MKQTSASNRDLHNSQMPSTTLKLASFLPTRSLNSIPLGNLFSFSLEKTYKSKEIKIMRGTQKFKSFSHVTCTATYLTALKLTKKTLRISQTGIWNWGLDAQVRFRVPVLVWYGDTTILGKVEYGYGGDICFIKFFIYYYAYIFHILINICEFKRNYR